jgi:predicted small secreted protein
MRTVIVLLLMLSILIAACGTNTDSEAGNSVVDEPIDVTTLRERASDLDGETVTVRSSYWSDGQTQYLSDIMMESYPPQIPVDQAVILVGELPSEVFDALNHADPSFAQITWGEVEITGRVVAGEHVQLEIGEALIPEA